MPAKGKKVKSTKDSDTTPRPTTNSNIPVPNTNIPMPDVVVPEFSAEDQGGVFGSYSQPASQGEEHTFRNTTSEVHDQGKSCNYPKTN